MSANMSCEEGLRLLAAFRHIQDPEMRARLISIVERIATQSPLVDNDFYLTALHRFKHTRD